jgi:aspartate/methionine/tyrosine aminotransferase
MYSHYGPDEGLPELRTALQRKIEDENGLRGVSGPAAMLT